MDYKDIIKNFSIRSVGGAADDEPVIKPYGGGNRSESQLLLSKEVFEVIDLLSEGPIYGLVDANGARVKGNKNLCGIYLDDTPVRVTRQQDYTQWEKEQLWPITNSGTTSYTANDPDGIVYGLSEYDNNINEIIGDETLGDEEWENINNVYQNNEQLKTFFRALKEEELRTRDPFQFYQTPDIKFVIIPHTDITFSNMSNVNKGNTDVAVYYSGINGTGELFKRYAKRGNPNSTYFEQSTAVEIPEPVLNISTRVGSKTIITTNAGYVLLALASGDGLEVDGGKLKFSTVDGNCIDPISQELSGAFLFLKARTDDLTNAFNFEQFNMSLNKGYESQPLLENFSETVRAYDTPAKLYGPIIEQSFEDVTDPTTYTKIQPSNISAAYEPDQSRFDSLTPAKVQDFYGDAIESVTKIEGNYDYGKWARASLGSSIGSEESILTHNVDNEAVSAVSVVMTINALRDTAIDGDEAGEPLPTVAALRIEVGIIGDADRNDPLWETLINLKEVYDIGIEGLVLNSPFRFTVGSSIGGNNAWLATTTYTRKGAEQGTTFAGGPQGPIPLPPSIGGRSRYVKVYRLTPETFSSKKTIEFSVNTINEHYAYRFSYPLSAVAGLSIDSRSFARIPTRSYDARLKQVLIPSNYFPLDGQGMDKREIKYKSSYQNDKQIYLGDWDGTFRRDWTDNPAWILYDLLTDPVYGIGNNIEDLKDIDIWTLYKIGRYCDAVDDNGYYIGVEDGYGGLEPRFSCNVVLQNERDALDVINTIATIFKGITFYGGGSINFAYDHQEDPMAIFGNQNVKGGAFTYSDSLKSSRFTVVEVPYIDKKNNYLQKIEAAEDEEAIQKYGYIKKTFEGFGITSRGQAQRLARYALYSNNIETEQVSFTASKEGYFIQPSDIIRIEDELKNIDTANGYIRHIDYENKYIITDHVPTGGFDTGIFFYTPSGRGSIQELFDKVYEQDLEVSLEDIEELKNPQIQLYKIDSFEEVTKTLGGSYNIGSGIKINLNASQSNINTFDDIAPNSMFSIRLTGRNDHLYRVINISYNENDEVGVMAVQHEPRKYALIESGIKFDEAEDFWSDRDLNILTNHPLQPLGVNLYTGISNGGIDFTGMITGNTSGVTPIKYLCTLTSPAGNTYEKTIDNETTIEEVYFNHLTELGTYTFATKAIGPAPNNLKSLAASTNLEILAEDTYVYNQIGVTGFSLTNGFGVFNAAQQTGTYSSFEKGIRLSWQIRDRMGATITTQREYRDRGIKVSLDLLDKDGVIVSNDVMPDSQNSNFYLSPKQIQDYFKAGGYGTEYPRDFEVDLRINGQDAPESTGTLKIQNWVPTINNMSIIDFFDGVANNLQFYFKGNSHLLYDTDKITLYTGNNTGFTTIDNTTKFIETSFDIKSVEKKKRVGLFTSNMYSSFVNNTLIAEHSIKDCFYINGEKVYVESDGSYPTNLAANTPYELIRGDALRTRFSIDVENSYNTGGGSGIGIQVRTYDSGIAPGWENLVWGIGAFDGTSLITGLAAFQNNAANLPTPIYTGYLNHRTQRYGGIYFNKDGAINISSDKLSSQIATSLTQSGSYNLTVSSQFFPQSGNPTDPRVYDTRTIIDLSSISGGCYLALITGTADADKIISGNIRLAGSSPSTTGDLVTLTSQTGYNWNDWNHVVMSLNTFSGNNCWSGYASLIINGTLRDSGLWSGSGMRFSYGPQALGMSRGLLCTGNAGRFDISQDRGWIGLLNSTHVYNESTNLEQAQAMQYGTYNQYIFKLANVGTRYPISLSDNVSNKLNIVSDSGRSLNINFSNYVNAKDYTLYDKIVSDNGFNGIQKQIFIQFDSATEQIEKDIVGIYSLREEDFKGHLEGQKRLIWQHFQGRPFAIQYISGADDNLNYTTGRWILFSGDPQNRMFDKSMDKDLYMVYDENYILDTDPSGLPPIGASWYTGSGQDVFTELSNTRKPKTTRRAGPQQRSRFKDLYIRAVLHDDIGTGNVFPPIEEPAMIGCYAVMQNDSQSLAGYKAKILGDQTRTLSDFIFAVGGFAQTITTFDEFTGIYLGSQSTESYLPEDQPTLECATPIITPSSFNSYPSRWVSVEITGATQGSLIEYKVWQAGESEPSIWTDGNVIPTTTNFNVHIDNVQVSVKARAVKEPITPSQETLVSYHYFRLDL